jgi:hypothetical protein
MYSTERKFVMMYVSKTETTHADNVWRPLKDKKYLKI